MEKSTESFFKKLFGKKKSGCCGVVVEEVGPEEQSQNPGDDPQPKCCEKTPAESNSN